MLNGGTFHPAKTSLRGAIERLLPEALGFLRRLVEANSFTENVDGVRANARLVAEQFAPLGFAAEQVAAADSTFGDHLFLKRAGTGGHGLLLVTHLDTVYPPVEEIANGFHWSVEGDRIYGPGVNDNKGGTAMIWLVLMALREIASEVFERTAWLIAANAAEEELVKDFPQACEARLPAGCRAALIFEACGGMGRGLTLVRSRKGSANFRVTVSGRGAHAGSRHHEGANAIVEMAEKVKRIAALTDYTRDLTANVGFISGGGPSNRVPHLVTCEVNIRAFDPEVLQGAIDAMFALEHEEPVVRAQSDGLACTTKVELLSRNPAWPRNAGTNQLIELWIESARELGTELLVETRGGLSDGNYISQFLPALDGLGPFGLNGHASERSADGSKVPEFVLTQSFVEMGEVTATAIRELCRRED